MYAIYSVAMDDEKRINEQLSVLRDQHQQLGKRIDDSARQLNMIELQRLKKQKLFLKDQIAKLQSELVPDIMA